MATGKINAQLLGVKVQLPWLYVHWCRYKTVCKCQKTDTSGDSTTRRSTNQVAKK